MTAPTQSTLTVTRNTRYCMLFLMRGRCSYGSRCRYQHLGWEAMPLQTLQDVLVSKWAGTLKLHTVSLCGEYFFVFQRGKIN